jgi:serine/threonine protein phosphatase PrpC
MEDAHINQAKLTNTKHAIFGVFDGHGGTFWFRQALRSPPSWNATSSKNCKKTRTTLKETMRLLSGKPSYRWTFSSTVPMEEQRSSRSKRK